MIHRAAGAGIVAEAVTFGPKSYFFGYYDKHQWDITDRYLLGLETNFEDRPPGPGEEARILLIDTHENNKAEAIATTRAWCWQQGCMLQWLPGRADEIIYNDRIGDRFVGVILNIATGKRRLVPRPIYSVSPDGTQALSLNFSRLAVTRPGYGYAGLCDPFADDPHPEEDGVYRMDLRTGDYELLVSLDTLANLDPDPSMEGATHWVNHLLFNPTGERLIFLHRWRNTGPFRTRMYTVGTDGRALHRVPVENASHFIWYSNDRILVWAKTSRFGNAYHVCRDFSDKVEALGLGVLTKDGHITVSPPGGWILTDEYPGASGNRPIILFKPSQAPENGNYGGERIDLGFFPSSSLYKGEIRCDLHPRWNRAGTKICFDSVHEGRRRMYVMDVSSLVLGG